MGVVIAFQTRLFLGNDVAKKNGKNVFLEFGTDEGFFIVNLTKIPQTLSAEFSLSYSHYLFLMRTGNRENLIRLIEDW